LLERAVSLEHARLQAGVSDTSSPSFALSMRLMLAGRLGEARERMGMSLGSTASSEFDRGTELSRLLNT
jgi:hypothetical protein